MDCAGVSLLQPDVWTVCVLSWTLPELTGHALLLQLVKEVPRDTRGLNNSVIIIGCTRAMTPYVLIKISFKSRGEAE